MITKPDSCIGFWFALEDATLENGCLWVSPESHKNPTTYFFKRNKQGTDVLNEGEKPDYDLKGSIPLTAKKGTLIFFDGKLVHYSKENTSPYPRPALTLHFVEGDATYDPQNWI